MASRVLGAAEEEAVTALRELHRASVARIAFGELPRAAAAAREAVRAVLWRHFEPLFFAFCAHAHRDAAAWQLDPKQACSRQG